MTIGRQKEHNNTAIILACYILSVVTRISLLISLSKITIDSKIMAFLEEQVKIRISGEILKLGEEVMTPLAKLLEILKNATIPSDWKKSHCGFY